MSLSLNDYLLMSKSFTFQSDLSPAECAAQIEQMSSHSIGNEKWIGKVEQSKSVEWLYTFEIGVNEFSSRPAVIAGVLKQAETGSGSIVSGVARYSDESRLQVISDEFRTVMLFVTIGMLLFFTAGTVTIGGFNTYWLNMLGGLGVLGLLLAFLTRHDKRINAIIELLELRLKAQPPQPTHDLLRLGLLDRLMLARVFTFRSDLSPAACAERINALTTQEEDEGMWIGTMNAVVDAGADKYWFELKLRRQAVLSDGSIANARMQGVIEQGDALGGSVIIGVLRSNLSIWGQLVVPGVILLFLPLTVSFASSTPELYGSSCLWVCGIGFVLVFSSSVAWVAWTDRDRTLKRLERSLQTNYRAQKKKVNDS